MILRYGYEEYRAAAIEDPSEENLANLGEWFQQYGMEFWNGECWDADGYELRPVYEWDEETGTGTICGYELR